MSLPKIVYSVQINERSDGFTYEESESLITIKLFYKKEDAENHARMLIIKKLEEIGMDEETIKEIPKMSWKLIQSNSDNWFKGYTVPIFYSIKIIKTEIN